MMYRFRTSMLRSGIAAAGCALFALTLSIACASFILFGLAEGFPVVIRGSEVALFVGSFLLFETAYFVYIDHLIRKNLRAVTDVAHPLLMLAADTVCLAAVFSLAALVVKMEIASAVKVPLLLSISFCGGLCFLSAARVFSNILLVRILCERSGFLPMLSEGGTVSIDRLIELTERLYGYCARFNIPLSFVGIRINADPAELKSRNMREHDLFIRQVAFLLAENSRSYEPWALQRDMSSFLCIVQARDSLELDATIKRFEAVIKKAAPFYFRSGYTPELHIVSETFTANLYDEKRGEKDDEIIQRAFGRIIARLAPGGTTIKENGVI